MRLTEEQFNVLTPYEEQFSTMIRRGWCRLPNRNCLDLFLSIYITVTGKPRTLNRSCRRCIENLVLDMGKIYMKDKEERINLENDRIMAEMTIKDANAPAKKKTTKKKDAVQPVEQS